MSETPLFRPAVPVPALRRCQNYLFAVLAPLWASHHSRSVAPRPPRARHDCVRKVMDRFSGFFAEEDDWATMADGDDGRRLL